MDIIKDIKENVKKGEEEIKEFGEEIVEEFGEDTKEKEEKESSKKISEKAEKESIEGKTKDEIEKKKKELLEKAEKLKEKLKEKEPKTKELKEKVKGKKKTEMLVPLDEYVKSGIYLGTRAVTPNMKPFVYRRRADGLAIFNTDIIDEKLKEGIEYLSKFSPEEVILVCKRDAGWKAVEKFGELTGIRIFTKKYPAGILTNTLLPDFFENELTIITDQWIDKNALQDTLKVNKKVLMICDTNNFSKGADKIIIGNNKSEKSLELIFYLLAKGYMKARGMDLSKIPDLEEWKSEKD
jgi:small subunit ribosomal protein S2